MNGRRCVFTLFLAIAKAGGNGHLHAGTHPIGGGRSSTTRANCVLYVVSYSCRCGRRRCFLGLIGRRIGISNDERIGTASKSSSASPIKLEPYHPQRNRYFSAIICPARSPLFVAADD